MDPIHYCQLTDRGRVRERNEDSCFAAVPGDSGGGAGPGAFFAVADGLGGLADGEVASAEAVAVSRSHYESSRGEESAAWIKRAIEEANRRIFAVNSTKEPSAWMATTLTLSLFRAGRLYVGHVGDCRLYRIRKGVLTQITQDHALDAHTLLRAVGTGPEVEPDFLALDVRNGDVYVQCSDGMHGMVRDGEIAELAENREGDACRKLVDLANRRGGVDNITVQIIRIG